MPSYVTDIYKKGKQMFFVYYLKIVLVFFYVNHFSGSVCSVFLRQSIISQSIESLGCIGILKM